MNGPKGRGEIKIKSYKLKLTETKEIDIYKIITF